MILLLTPILCFAIATLPPDSEFDAKKEMKRVVRREHLQVRHCLPNTGIPDTDGLRVPAR
jgi:hypothetical protein